MIIEALNPFKRIDGIDVDTQHISSLITYYSAPDCVIGFEADPQSLKLPSSSSSFFLSFFEPVPSEEKVMAGTHHPLQVVPDATMDEQEQIDLATALSLSIQDHPPPAGEGEE